jgi:hypothetical protein
VVLLVVMDHQLLVKFRRRKFNELPSKQSQQKVKDNSSIVV